MAFKQLGRTKCAINFGKKYISWNSTLHVSLSLAWKGENPKLISAKYVQLNLPEKNQRTNHTTHQTLHKLHYSSTQAFECSLITLKVLEVQVLNSWTNPRIWLSCLLSWTKLRFFDLVSIEIREFTELNSNLFLPNMLNAVVFRALKNKTISLLTQKKNIWANTIQITNKTEAREYFSLHWPARESEKNNVKISNEEPVSEIWNFENNWFLVRDVSPYLYVPRCVVEVRTNINISRK